MFFRKVHLLSFGKVATIPITIRVIYYLNYSLAARLQGNSRPKSPTKEETAIYCLWMVDNEREESGSEKRKL